MPVILTDAAHNWKARAELTPQYFKENYGQISKEINGVSYKLVVEFCPNLRTCISFGRSQLNSANWDLLIADNYRALKKKVSFLAWPLLVYGKIAGSIINKQEDVV